MVKSGGCRTDTVFMGIGKLFHIGFLLRIFLSGTDIEIKQCQAGEACSRDCGV